MRKFARSWLGILLPSILLSACFQTRSDIQQEKEKQAMETSLQQSIADQSQSLEDLQQNVARLQGRVEELDHGRKSDAGSEQKTQEDFSKKLSAITTRLDAIEQKQEVLFSEITKLKQEALQAPKVSELAPMPQKKAGGNYDGGVTAFRSRQYGDAIAAFNAYLKSGSNLKHFLDAHYFIGESNYQQKNYSQAILSFNTVHEKGGKGALGRKATLRIAQSFAMMGKNKEAKSFAQLLVDMSPDSAEAKTARKFLK